VWSGSVGGLNRSHSLHSFTICGLFVRLWRQDEMCGRCSSWWWKIMFMDRPCVVVGGAQQDMREIICC
jgi:hypothetical protein